MLVLPPVKIHPRKIHPPKDFSLFPGHIRSALNFPMPQQTAQLVDFISTLHPDTIVILHCEFSQRRAPYAGAALVKLAMQDAVKLAQHSSSRDHDPAFIVPGPRLHSPRSGIMMLGGGTAQGAAALGKEILGCSRRGDHTGAPPTSCSGSGTRAPNEAKKTEKAEPREGSLPAEQDLPPTDRSSFGGSTAPAGRAAAMQDSEEVKLAQESSPDHDSARLTMDKHSPRSGISGRGGVAAPDNLVLGCSRQGEGVAADKDIFGCSRQGALPEQEVLGATSCSGRAPNEAKKNCSHPEQDLPPTDRSSFGGSTAPAGRAAAPRRPSIYVMKGGYSAFWKEFPQLCEKPDGRRGEYTRMADEDYLAEFELVCSLIG